MLDIGIAGLSAGSLLFLLASALTAGVARGFSGFGGALIFIPLASAVLGPKVAVPVFLITDFVLASPMVPGAWRRADRAGVAIMSLGASIGVPLGTYLLTQIDAITIRWAITVLVITMLALLISGWRYHGKPTPPLTVAVGVASGFCSGAAQAGGPPVVAYWLGGFIAVATVRANIVLFFAISSVLSLASYLVGGLITLAVLKLAVVIGPAFGIGLWSGAHLFGRSNDLSFRRICYTLIAVAAIVGLPALDGVLR